MKLGMYNRGLLPIIVCTNDDPGVNLTYFMTRSNLVLWKKVKTVAFSESIAPYDLKVCRCRQLIEFMKVCEYRRSMSFLDLGPRPFMYEN